MPETAVTGHGGITDEASTRRPRLLETGNALGKSYDKTKNTGGQQTQTREDVVRGCQICSVGLSIKVSCQICSCHLSSLLLLSHNPPLPLRGVRGPCQRLSWRPSCINISQRPLSPGSQCVVTRRGDLCSVYSCSGVYLLSGSAVNDILYTMALMLLWNIMIIINKKLPCYLTHILPFHRLEF